MPAAVSQPDYRDSALKSGFLEIALRTAGRHPFLCWALPWMTILLPLIAIQFTTGFDRGSINFGPPPASAIPYHAWLPGGSNHGLQGIELRPECVPAYQRPTEQMHVQSYLLNGRGRILCSTMSRGAIGWPRPIATFTLQRTWDVTNPCGPFFLIRDFFTTQGLDNHLLVIEGGASVLSVGVKRKEALTGLLVSQAVSLLFVLPLHTWYKLRQRKRLKRGQCLACGHNLDPMSRAARCPECGAAVLPADATIPRRRLRPLIHGPTRAFFTLWLISIIVVAGYLAAHPRESPRQTAVERAHARTIEALGWMVQDGVPQQDERELDARRAYGWPSPFLVLERYQWFHQAMWAAPVPAPVPRDYKIPGNASNVISTWIDEDNPSLFGQVQFDWKMTLIAALALECLAAAVVLAGLILLKIAGLLRAMMSRREFTPRSVV